jgi:hypothetical protein
MMNGAGLLERITRKAGHEHRPTATLGASLWTWANRVTRESYLLICLALLVLSSLFALQLLRGSVLYGGWSEDIFIHLNGILHIKEGSLPHIGFNTPVGAFYYFAFYLTTYFAAPSAYTAVYANGLVAGLAVGLALLAGYRRLHAGWTAALMLHVGLVAMSPRQLGDTFISFNAAYHRWSWAMFAVLAVVVSLPRVDAERPRAALMDGLLSAVLVALLFFTKATYAVVGLGLILASVGTVRRNAHRWLYSLSTAAALALLIIAVELKFGILLPYIADLQRTAQAQGGTSRAYQLLVMAFHTAADHVLILLIAAVASFLSNTRASVGHIIYLLVLMGAELAIAMQHHRALEIPLVPVTALIAFQLFRSRLPVPAKPGVLVVAVTAAVLLLFLKPMAADAMGVLDESLDSSAPGPAVDWLRETPLRDLALRAAPNRVLSGGGCLGGPPQVVGDREYFSVLQDGVRLLNKHPLAGARVLSLTRTNPFPILIGGPPVRNELSWWDRGRTFNASVHPQPETLFRGVDYVLIPKLVEWSASTRRAMLSIYGAEIQRRYTLLEESGCWRLMGAIDRP